MMNVEELIGYCLIAIAVGTAISIFFKESYFVGMILLPIGFYYLLVGRKKLKKSTTDSKKES